MPAAQTHGTVQLDEVLTALQSDTRADLQTLTQGYGEALNGEPRPGEDADQDPSTRGQTAGESLNDSLMLFLSRRRSVTSMVCATLLITAWLWPNT